MTVRTISLRISLAMLLIAALSCSTGGDPLSFSPDALPTVRVGVPFTVTIAVHNNDQSIGAISLVSGALPRGVNLRYTSPQSTATLEGTPDETGTFGFTIAAYSYGVGGPFQQGKKDYRLEVQP
jgi:hypothetical protein